MKNGQNMDGIRTHLHNPGAYVSTYLVHLSIFTRNQEPGIFFNYGWYVNLCLLVYLVLP